jgi:hypothetical protein
MQQKDTSIHLKTIPRDLALGLVHRFVNGLILKEKIV